MKQNMGLADRSLRLLIAVILGLIYFSDADLGAWKIVMLAVTCILAVTAILGFCPLYRVFHWDTSNGPAKKGNDL